MTGKSLALTLALAAAAMPAGASELADSAKAILPPFISYIELDEPQTVTFGGREFPYTAGQLVVDFARDGMYLTGYVISTSTEDDPLAAEVLAPYFRYQLRAREYEGLTELNRALFDEESPLHLALEASISDWADRMVGGAGAQLEVTLSDIEPVRRAGEMGAIVYTAGARIILSSEGLIMPLYGRCYMYRDGAAYRTVSLITSDDSREYLGYALADMVGEAARRAADRNLRAFIDSIDLSDKD